MRAAAGTSALPGDGTVHIACDGQRGLCRLRLLLLAQEIEAEPLRFLRLRSGLWNRAAVSTSPLLPPPPRTKWTRRVPPPVLIGHAASFKRTAQRPCCKEACGGDLGKRASGAGCGVTSSGKSSTTRAIDGSCGGASAAG